MLRRDGAPSRILVQVQAEPPILFDWCPLEPGFSHLTGTVLTPMTSNSGVYYCADIGDGSSLRPWHLDDLSDAGARLRVDRPDDIPDHLSLLLKGDVVKILRCHVVWRSSSHIGVEFETSAGDNQDSA